MFSKKKILLCCRLMRFDKPVGIFLLLWPTYWGLWVSSRGIPNFHILLIFTIEVIIMRASGCVINDLIDRKIDVHIRRTMYRPLVIDKSMIQTAIWLFFF